MTTAALFSDGSATFSDDQRHRYTLSRILRPVAFPRSVLFVMLNPSTATAEQDDPTIRRCIGFARAWGYDRLDVANLFSLRSTDPKALYADPWRARGDPTNAAWIVKLASDARMVVAAWGVHGALTDRGASIRRLIAETGLPPRHLGLTKEGHPRHPLYLRGNVEPQQWEAG